MINLPSERIELSYTKKIVNYKYAAIKAIKRDKYLILMSIPGLLITFLFKYLPIYGLLMVFTRYNPAKGIWGSEWVGFYYFESIFKDPYIIRCVKNTLLLGIYSLVWSFPAPIVLALLLNEVKTIWFKKMVQTLTYLPHFISAVIFIGFLRQILSPSTGLINFLLSQMGIDKINFFGRQEWFRTLYIGSGILQGVGFGAIIYLAALSNIDVSIYEAAIIDGANRWQRIIYINIPGIMPTVSILLIFALAGILGNDSLKILLMYSPQTYETADVLGTYIYRMGIENNNFSFGAALGLMLSIVSFILIVVSNYASKKISETSLW